jgi:hypothetical protein
MIPPTETLLQSSNLSSLQPHLNLSHITSMATIAASLIPRRTLAELTSVSSSSTDRALLQPPSHLLSPPPSADPFSCVDQH